MKTGLNKLVPGLLQSIIPGTTSTEKTKQDIHLHGMWHQPVPIPRISNRDKHFQQKLVGMYLEMVDASRALPANADAHLWTDRNSLSVFRVPFQGPNGNVIEIPFSMLDRSPVVIHLRKDMDQLIDGLKNKQTKSILRDLYTHPATFNIGFKNDIEKLLFCTLYTGKGTAQEVQKDEMNFYIDRDTLSKLRDDLICRDRGWTRQFAANDYERTVNRLKFMGYTVPEIPDRIRSHALHENTRPDSISPRRALDLEPNEARAEARANISELRTLRGQAHPDSIPERRGVDLKPDEVRAKIIEPYRKKTSVELPASLLRQGYMPRDQENDFLAATPGHSRAINIAKQIQRGLEKTAAVRTNDAWSSQVIWNHAVAFCQYDARNINDLDQQRVLDYFRLAQKILALGPKLRDRILELEEFARHPTTSGLQKRHAIQQIQAIRAISERSDKFIYEFVNVRSYLPEAIKLTKQHQDDFDQLSQKIFGMKVPRASTGSWGASTSLPLCFPRDAGMDDDDFEPALRTAFKYIKSLLPASTTDDM